MAKIVTLKSPSDEDIYPVTDASGIRVTGNVTLQQALDGFVYADDPTRPATPNAWVTSSDIDWSTIEYSTTEQVVGKWIDGRLVYRKVLAGTTDYNNAESINHGITNFGAAINIYGYIHASNGESQPIPRVVPDNISGYGIGVGDIDSTRIAFQHPSGNYKGRPYAIIMEYIKTS